MTVTLNLTSKLLAPPTIAEAFSLLSDAAAALTVAFAAHAASFATGKAFRILFLRRS
jgi:hypothetical protein